ncbi:Cytidine deaminase [Serratia plymuthica]|uniref:Cytidine deaminase n=1 Tax=Serratia plymuthica TaxID=82996 RepID=A0A2X4UMM8_SERPL|nr:Cytidine deaminase [Serratia plymuthica]
MHPRFHTAFGELSATLQSVLLPYFDAPDFPAMFRAEQVDAIKQRCGLDDDALAFALLPLAAACSLTPISHFHVGAIARARAAISILAPIWNSAVRRCNKPFMQNSVP